MAQVQLAKPILLETSIAQLGVHLDRLADHLARLEVHLVHPVDRLVQLVTRLVFLAHLPQFQVLALMKAYKLPTAL